MHDGNKCMLCWILAFYDVDAVHFLKDSVEYSVMFTQRCMSVLHETQGSLDVGNCKLGLTLALNSGPYDGFLFYVII